MLDEVGWGVESLELNCGMCLLQSDIVGIECREQLGCASLRVDETGGCLVGFPGVVVLPWVSVPRRGGVDEEVIGSVDVPGKSRVFLSCRWVVRVQVDYRFVW